MLMPVLPPIYSAVAASTPPSRKPVTAERRVSWGMSPRNTFSNHQWSFWLRVQVRICSSVSWSSAMAPRGEVGWPLW